MKKNCTPFLLGAFLLTMSVTASAQNTAITFDGSGAGYVITGTNPDLTDTNQNVIPDFKDFTAEGWFYIPAYQSGQHVFLSQGDQGSGFYIGYDGDDPNHSIHISDQWVTAGATGSLHSSGITMPVGKWVHIAVTVDGNNFIGTLFINGIQAAQTTDGGLFVSSSNNPLEFGLQFAPSATPPVYIQGSMDQVRIWKYQRSGAQIRSGMYGTVDPATAGLLAYYSMNDNTSGLTVKNNSTSPDALGSWTDGTWAGTSSWTASPIQSASNALTFGGGTTTFPQVTIPENTAYDLSSGGTIELYAMGTGLTSTPGTLISNSGGGNTRYTIQATNTQIILDNGTSTATINYALPVNTWVHLAFVNNGSGSTDLYRNSDVAPLGTFSLALGSASGQDITVGADNNAHPFRGSIDEVRIWTSQQTQAQIAANLLTPLTGSESGLAGLFNFDQGTADGDNTGLLTIPDNTATMNDASLANFALTTASASNFTQHNLVPLPVNFTSFTAVAQQDQSLLKWQTAQEQNSREFIVERSVDGLSYSEIGSVDAAGNSSSPSNYSFVDAAPVTGKNYYRLKETDLDNKFMYSDIRIVNFLAITDGEQKLVWFQTGDKAVEVDLRQGNNETYTVSDISGRMIQQGQLSSGKLTISQVPGGLYFVKVITTTGKQLDTRVIVK